MTHRHHPWLKGRDPEFAQPSLKPGIGYDFMHEVASVMLQYPIPGEGDVPVTLAHGKIQLPLGRYLRQKLRLMIGREQKAPPNEKQSAEMRDLYLAALKDPSFISIKQTLTKLDDQTVLNMEARAAIFKKRLSL